MRNKIIQSLKLYSNNPKLLILSIMSRTCNLWSDKTYLKIVYYLRFGRKLNLKTPKSYTEKLNWLKIHDIHPEYSKFVDKATVKNFVAERLKSQDNIIKTIGVWNSFDEIDFCALPEQFVLKTTNGGGNEGVVICTNKSNIDYSRARKKLRLVSSKIYKTSREYVYYNVTPRIIAEEFLKAPNNELSDYKFFCFDGEPKFLFVGSDRQVEGEDVKFDFFDTDFNYISIINGHSQAKKRPERPKNFEEMLEITRKLSAGFKHVRVDLYNVDGKIYFGELTFFHHAGFVPITPYEWDLKFGEFLNIN